MDLLDLMVKVGIKDEASDKVDNVSNGLKGKLSTAAKAGAAALAAVTAAAAAMAAHLVSSVKDVAAYGDNIDKKSQKMGMSASAYQEWDAVMQHSGTSMETLKASMKTLANAAESNNDAFARLGITQEQLASMSQEELFAATIEGLQGVTDTTERTYLAGQLLGRGATELGPLLNMSAEETQAMRDRVHELGGVMSDEAVKASAAFQDSMQDLNTALDGAKRNMVANFLPGVTGIMDGLQELLIGNVDEGEQLINDGLDSIITALDENGPKFVEVVERIGGIVLPKLIEVIAKLLGALITEIVTHIPDILKLGLELIMSLVKGLAQGLGPLLSQVGELIMGAIDRIGSFVGGFFSAGANIIWSLISAVGNTLASLPGVIWNWIQSAVQSVASFASSFYNAGVNIVTGLINGIAANIGAVIDTILGGVQNAVGGVLSFLGIASPSKLFAWMGDMTMEGLAEGIEKTASEAENAMRNAAEGIYSAAEGEVTMDVTANTSQAQSGLIAEIKGLRDDVRALKLAVNIDGKSTASVLYPYIDRIMYTEALKAGAV